MRNTSFIIVALSLGACTPSAPDAPPSFDIASLKAGDDSVTLTGWFDPSEDFRQFRLYPKAADMGAIGKANCVSGIATSLAGIPTAEYKGEQMAITGTLAVADGPDVGDTKDVCGSGLILIANDISVPEK